MDIMKNEKTIYFSKVRKDAIIPDKDIWNAGFDIYACFDEEYIIIPSFSTKLIPSGIASAIPQDYYIQIQERGSSGSKGIKYSAGVIDSSYRGEWFLATTNINIKPIIILKKPIEEFDDISKAIIEETLIVYPYSKALFQGIIHNVHNDIVRKEISFEKLKEISSLRGDGNLGSSGK